MPFISDIALYEDGYVILGEKFIGEFDINGNCLSSIRDIGISAEGSLVVEGDYLYLAKNTNGIMEYFRINFENHRLNKVTDSGVLGLNGAFCLGEYYCDGYQIKKVNIDAGNTSLISDFNYVDIRPASERLSTPTNTVVINDDRFVVTNQYESNTVEIQRFTYNPSINTAYDRTLTIGGYGCRDDLPLMWAVYLFNRSHDDTRAILTDYANEGFGYVTGQEAATAKAELIQYFNQGNAPDIYYGDSFDYNYFGRNGMAIDLMPYVETELDTLSDTARALMFNEDNTCYQVFSSYMLDGYFAPNDFELHNPSISQVEETVDELQKSLDSGSTYAQILDTVVRYEIPNRVNNGDDHYFSIEELISAIEYSLKYGYPDYDTAWTMGSLSDPALSLVLLGDAQAYCSYYSGNDFVGYPSFDHSNKVAKPFGLVAISDSCDNPALAWTLIRHIFDPEVQNLCIADWKFPVSEASVQDYRNSLEAIADGTTITEYGYLEERNIVTCENVARYFEIMLSANAIQTNDWDVFNIIVDEMNSYSQGKSTDEIAHSLQSRLDLYIEEMYR